MGRRAAGTGRAGNDNPTRVQLGPFWLWYRAERDEWAICWYDDGGPGRGRRTCRKATGIRGGEAGRPPAEAEAALADHFAAWRKPVEQAPTEALVEGLLADWLKLHVEKGNADTERPKFCVARWLEFFEIERKAGRITRGPFVSDIKRAMCERFMEWRFAKGVSGATISRELAALRATLRWAWQNERISAAPFIPEVDAKKRPGPKDLVYSPEQVARILEAARRLPERHHVHLFVMIMLSTHGRGEAILELDAETQIRDGLIYFNAPGRAQTRKRRSIVPIAPTLAPWLEDVTGKVIVYRTEDKEGNLIEKPAASIKTAFKACLIEAGICEQATDAKGNPQWHEKKRGSLSRRRPKMRGIGSPNTLRHTIATEMHKRGIDERQIDQAAGHAPVGTNKKNYMHLRPDYLSGFIAGVEDYWAEVGQHTTAHLRSQCDPKVVNLANRRAGRRLEK